MQVRRYDEQNTKETGWDSVGLLLLCVLVSGTKAENGASPGIPARMDGPVIVSNEPGCSRWVIGGPHASPYAAPSLPETATDALALGSGHAPGPELWPERTSSLHRFR